jgi:hypothetical protein
VAVHAPSLRATGRGRRARGYLTGPGNGSAQAGSARPVRWTRSDHARWDAQRLCCLRQAHPNPPRRGCQMTADSWVSREPASRNRPAESPCFDGVAGGGVRNRRKSAPVPPLPESCWASVHPATHESEPLRQEPSPAPSECPRGDGVRFTDRLVRRVLAMSREWRRNIQSTGGATGAEPATTPRSVPPIASAPTSAGPRADGPAASPTFPAIATTNSSGASPLAGLQAPARRSPAHASGTSGEEHGPTEERPARGGGPRLRRHGRGYRCTTASRAAAARASA